MENFENDVQVPISEKNLLSYDLDITVRLLQSAAE